MKNSIENSFLNKKDFIKNEFLNIFKENEGNSSSRSKLIQKYVEKLLESNSEFLELVLSSTKDLREISEKVYIRAWEHIEANKIKLVQNDQYSIGRFSTMEGVKLEKLDGPNFFEDPDGYQKFIENQKKLLIKV